MRWTINKSVSWWVHLVLEMCLIKLFDYYWRIENEIVQANNFGLNDPTKIRMWMRISTFNIFFLCVLFSHQTFYVGNKHRPTELNGANLLKTECHAQPTDYKWFNLQFRSQMYNILHKIIFIYGARKGKSTNKKKLTAFFIFFHSFKIVNWSKESSKFT